MKEFDIPGLNATWLSATLAQLELIYQSAEPLRVEASHRTFYRIYTITTPLILMHSPPQLEANDRFQSLATAFARHHVAVPQILAVEKASGWFLMTDLGQTHLEDAYNTSMQTPALAAAIQQLALIAQTQAPDIEPYTGERLTTELEIFSEWFVGEMLQSDLDIISDCAKLVASIELQPSCCVHRDYHCRNLLYNDGKLGVVDFQDALQGPILYDIASLLRDCYHQFDESIVDQALADFFKLEHVREFASQHSQKELKEMFDFTAMQRQLKAIGIFSRLSLRDGKDSHLVHIRANLRRLVQLTNCYSDLEPLQQSLTACLALYDKQQP